MELTDEAQGAPPEQGGTLLLEGEDASGAEAARARAALSLLEALMPRLTEPGAQAQALHDIGVLRRSLGDVDGALAAMRDAFRRAPAAAQLARAYRKQALRAGAASDVVAALAAEAALCAQPAQKAVLELERGAVLERRLQSAPAARGAYLAALTADPQCLEALAALQRLALADGNVGEAADAAQRLVAAAVDPELQAEHAAAAARFLEEAGDHAAAQAQAVAAVTLAPGSPTAQFVLERLVSTEQSLTEVLALRQRQIEAGAVDAAAVSMEVGLLARYVQRDRGLAIDAFARAAETDEPGDKQVALAELESLLEDEQDWPRLAEVIERAAGLEGPPERRAAAWTRLAKVREERLGDDAGAVVAYERALGEDATYATALEGLGRLFQRLGRKDRQEQLHRLEARAATDATDRAAALRRLGELLLEDGRTDEGLQALREALQAQPGNLGVVAALERALTRKQAWEQLRDLYREEAIHATEPARRVWLLIRIANISADRLGDRARAVAALREAAQVPASGAPYALYRLAQLLEESDDADELSAVLEELAARESDPEQVASLLERVAQLHERRGADAADAAISAYKRAVAVAPPSHSVFISAGRAYLRERRYAELAALYEAASRGGAPAQQARWLTRAADVLAGHLDRADDAIARLQVALAQEPSYAPATMLLERLYTATGRWHELDALLAARPHIDARGWLRRAAIAEAAGDDLEAMSYYFRAARDGIKAATVPYARLLAKHGQWEDLVRLYQEGGGGVDAYVGAMRAAEIALEGLGDGEAGLERLAAAEQARPGALAPMLRRLHLAGDDVEAARAVLSRLVEHDGDPGARAAWLRQLGRLQEAALDPAAALATRKRLLQLAPLDPVAQVDVELALERAGEREALAALLRSVAGEARGAPELTAQTLLSLGGVLEELGQPRAAVDAYQKALALWPGGLLARLALPRLMRGLGESAAELEALAALAEALPPGSERAAALRTLGARLEGAGASERAIKAYEAALAADARDRRALAALDRLYAAAGRPELLIDPLLRALEEDDDPARGALLGAEAAARMIAADRLGAAREVLARARAAAPDDLELLLAQAELEEHAGSATALAEALEALAAHPDAGEALVREALTRLAIEQAETADDVEAARATLARLDALPPGDGAEDAAALELELVARESAGDAAGVRRLLARLVELAPDDEARGRLQLRLADHLEEAGELGPAVEALAAVSSPPLRRAALARLLQLGVRTGRWDLTGEALEAALDRGVEMTRDWELAVRTRLAALLEGPLGRPDAAVRQYARVVELDPDGSGDALARLARLAAKDHPDKALAYHRRVLETRAADAETLRALRELALLTGDDDSAFLAEAVLEGLGLASDEETYFYRQRRARLGPAPQSPLDEAARALLWPELGAPAFRLLGALEPALGPVFPVDLDGYGAGAAETDELAAATAQLARLFGVAATPRVHLVAPRLGPTVEPGSPSLLLLPRTVDDLPRREQLGMIGALVGRVASHGILGDPRRLTPSGAAVLEQLLDAACTLVEPDFAAPGRGKPVFEDIRRRLERALGEAGVAALAEPARALIEAGRPDGAALLAAMDTAAARAALVAAQDPAAVLAGLRGDAGASARAQVLAFALSEAHLALRKTLNSGVGA